MELNAEVNYEIQEDGLMLVGFLDESKDYYFSFSRFEDDNEVEIMVYDQLCAIIEEIEITLSRNNLKAKLPEPLAQKLDANLEYAIHFNLNDHQYLELVEIFKNIFNCQRGLEIVSS